LTKYTFLTHHDNKDVRSAAADALEEIGDPRALKPLNNALNDDDKEVRSAEKRAIYKFTNKYR